MNRRGFLGMLGAAIAGAAYDPDLALWVPGKKKIFIRPPFTWAEFQARYILPAVRKLADDLDGATLARGGWIVWQRAGGCYVCSNDQRRG